MTARTGMDAAHFDLDNSGGKKKRAAAPQSESAGSLWEHVAPTPATDLVSQLVAIANDLEVEHCVTRGPLYGVTIGEVVFEAEARGIKVGGAPMDDKVKEQRQTSWLPRVMKQADLVVTASYRPSPVKRHHGTPHKVWIRREVKP